MILVTKISNKNSFDELQALVRSVLNELDKKHKVSYLMNDDYVRLEEELRIVRKNNHAESFRNSFLHCRVRDHSYLLSQNE